MKLKLRLHPFFILSFLALGSTCMVSCDSDDTLPVEPEEATVAQLQSFSVKPGKNRVFVEGTVPANADIAEIRIYWNEQSDSKTIAVSSSSEAQQISTYIENLDEKFYAFEVQTVTAAGDGSILLKGGSEVYGDNYSNLLFNRPVNANVLEESSLTIEFGEMDLSTGVIGTQLNYETTEGSQEELFIPVSKKDLKITDFKAGTSYSYRSVFVPSPVAVDTFYTDNASYMPIEFPKLVNAAVPFAASSVSGRWGILEDWTTTDPVLIHNGHGGWDEWNNNIFNIESGWGAPAITNGKVYQSVMTGPGEFALEVSVRDSNHSESDEGGAYFVIAKGTTLPDVADVTTSSEVLAYERIHTTANSGTPEIYSIPYTIEEATTITIGQITTQWGQTPGRFCNIFSFEIVPGN